VSYHGPGLGSVTGRLSADLQQVAGFQASDRAFWIFQATVKGIFVWFGTDAATLVTLAFMRRLQMTLLTVFYLGLLTANAH